MEAIILAGGLGTRLRPLTTRVPKPMVPIAGRPFLEYMFRLLINQGVTRALLSTGYLGEQIVHHFGEEWQGLALEYVQEEEPLGTGGAIAASLPMIEGDESFIFNGDTLCQAELKPMLAFHRKKGADLTLALKPMTNFDRYGCVELSGDDILGFREKQFVEEGLINSGVYLVKKDLFASYDLPPAFSFENDFLPGRVRDIRARGFVTEGYFIDIGVPEEYQRAQKELPPLFGTKERKE